MPDRRRRAVPIRIEQEMRKRWEAVVAPVLPVALAVGPPELGLSSPARPGLSPVGRELLLAEARETALGRWRRFGGWSTVDPNAPGWRTHPESGLVSPLRHWSRVSYSAGSLGGDVKEIWEINRHRGLIRLAQAWYLEREPAMLSMLAIYLDSWLADNPPGEGINWTSSLEVAFRALAWTWVRGLTDAPQLWTADRDRAFAGSLWHHARHLMHFDSIHHSPNTHLTGEGLALACLGRAWPHWPGSEQWSARGDAILEEELRYQVLPDGMHAELAPGYHRYTTECYLLWLAAMQRTGKSPSDQSCTTIRKMVAALATLRRPDGRLPGIGDEDGGITLPLVVSHPRDPDPVLCLAAELLGTAGCPATGVPAARDLAWWVMGSAASRSLDQSAPAASPARLSSLPDAGYHVLRDADPEGWWCLVDGGPQATSLPGHSHADIGHVELLWGRQACVVDPGSLAYSPDPVRRDADRSPGSHATMMVEAAPLAVPSGPFRWARLGPVPHTVATAYADWSLVALAYVWQADDGKVLRHERQVAVVDEAGVVIVDRLQGAGGRTVRLTWPVPAETARIELAGNHAKLPGGLQLRWVTEGVDRWTPQLEEATFADTYRTPMPGTFLRLCGRATDEVLLIHSFFAAETGPRIAVTDGMVSVHRVDRPAVELSGGVA